MPEKSLPKKRRGTTYEIEILSTGGRFKIYLRTGLYEDGTPGEIFLDAAKMGSELRSLLNCWAILFSIALQWGVPLEKLVHTFSGVRFSPFGKMVCHVPEIGECFSIPDAVCRILKHEFLQENKPNS